MVHELVLDSYDDNDRPKSIFLLGMRFCSDLKRVH